MTIAIKQRVEEVHFNPDQFATCSGEPNKGSQAGTIK